MAWGKGSLNVEFARWDFDRETSERYEGFVVRSRLKRVLNEAVKSNATVREEEVRRFPGQYIDSVKFPDERVLWSKREIRDAFRDHITEEWWQACLGEIRWLQAHNSAKHRVKNLLTARVSAFVDDNTVFMSHRLDIKAVKKAVSEYEQIAGDKVNFDKSEGLRLCALRSSDTLPETFRWSDTPVCILGVWFVLDCQLERNWSEVLAKVDAQVGTWVSRRLSLNGRVQMCTVYVFPLFLYRLAVLPLPKVRRLALQWSLTISF